MLDIVNLKIILGVAIGFLAGLGVGLFCGRIIARNNKALKDAKLYRQYTERFRA